MNRRNFILAGICAATSAVLPFRRRAAGEHITIDYWRLHYGPGGCRHRLFVNGVDVTDRCCESHTGEGWAKCFVRNELGGFMRTREFVEYDRDGREIGRGGPVVETLRGRVEVRKV
jgi:hypothetical protein